MAAIRTLLFHTIFILWTLCLASSSYLPLPSIWYYRIARLWAQGGLIMLAGITGLKSKIVGQEHLPPSGYIVASQHQSTWETLALTLAVPCPIFVLKEELLRIPFLGRYLRCCRSIVVNRKAGSQSLRQMMRQARSLFQRNSDQVIIIFPEGTRRHPDAPVQILPGASVLHNQLSIPMVPAVTNSGRFWPRHGVIRPGQAVIRLLPPILPGQKPAQSTMQLAASWTNNAPSEPEISRKSKLKN